GCRRKCSSTSKKTLSVPGPANRTLACAEEIQVVSARAFSTNRFNPLREAPEPADDRVPDGGHVSTGATFPWGSFRSFLSPATRGGVCRWGGEYTPLSGLCSRAGKAHPLDLSEGNPLRGVQRHRKTRKRKGSNWTGQSIS